ncbi:MAG: hypothetical protein HOD92_17455 [Deltaproteobacteria bacterium]|mgnify:CR=1 FL=1|jgi:hypothetical protein|nr:hypothetical protein [Deltaproteobacteria bacterium]MBT4527270.1 hypothetical protein [Deltaproteobacteria bacterium]
MHKNFFFSLLFLLFIVRGSLATVLIPQLPEQDRLTVFPVIFLPSDTKITKAEEIQAKNRLSKHLKLARKHYSEILRTDTFHLSKSPVYRSFNNNEYFSKFKAAEASKSAFLITRELFAGLNDNRYQSNRIYLVVYKRPENKPYNGKFNMFGGGRTFNGLPNTGGGYVEMEYSSLISDFPYPFQSTLVHELGHAFGLAHVNCLGYHMTESSSIMSYNLTHHSEGFKVSLTPGGLHPEEYYVLSLNKRAFPDFNFIPGFHNPEKRLLESVQKCFLGPMSAELGKFESLLNVGYELFYNGQRVNGPEAAFYSFLQAENNCKWNTENQKQIKVECRYNGKSFIPGEKPMTQISWQNDIRFSSSQPEQKKVAIEMIDKSIGQASAFLSQQGLSGNLQNFLLDMVISIKDELDFYRLDLSPLSGEGHDFFFRVSKKTGILDQNSLVIGEVIPEPDENTMIDLSESELLRTIEGYYGFKEGKKSYRLNLPGPNTGKGKYQYGDFFSLSREMLFEEGGGILESISGIWVLGDKLITLLGTEQEQESWNEKEEAEGEAFVSPYEDAPLKLEISLSGDQPILSGIIYESEVELTKTKR